MKRKWARSAIVAGAVVVSIAAGGRYQKSEEPGAMIKFGYAAGRGALMIDASNGMAWRFVGDRWHLVASHFTTGTMDVTRREEEAMNEIFKRH